MKKIDLNKTYTSNNCGDYNIIEDNVMKKGNHTYVKIKFICTGNEKIVRKDNALIGKVRDDLYNIKSLDIIYESKQYGKYKILSYAGRNEANDELVRIKFLETGNETITRKRQAIKGNVLDPLLGFSRDKLYVSESSGPFVVIDRVINDNNESMLLIQFIETNYIAQAYPTNVKYGQVKDYYRNGVYRKPYNPLLYDNYEFMIFRKLKSIWKSMINRCCNENNIAYTNYGALGVSVCDYWLDFDNFLKDVTKLPQYDKFYINPSSYQLDKDYKQINLPKSARIYSLDTCMFLYYVDNTNLSIMDSHKTNNDKFKCNYYNVFFDKQKNEYKVNMNVDCKTMYLGAFTNEIAAANVANYWQYKFHTYELIPLINDVPYMSPQECMLYTKRLNKMIIERQDK